MAKKVAIVLASGFADWEYALIAGVGGPFYGLEVAFFAPQVGKFRSQGGLTVEVEKGVAELADWRPEVLVVVGGTLWGNRTGTGYQRVAQRAVSTRRNPGGHLRWNVGAGVGRPVERQGAYLQRCRGF